MCLWEVSYLTTTVPLNSNCIDAIRLSVSVCFQNMEGKLHRNKLVNQSLMYKTLLLPSKAVLLDKSQMLESLRSKLTVLIDEWFPRV